MNQEMTTRNILNISFGVNNKSLQNKIMDLQRDMNDYIYCNKST